VFIDAVQFFKPRSSFPTFRRFFLCKEWKAFVKTILHRDSQQTLAASVGQHVQHIMKTTSKLSLVLVLAVSLCPAMAQVTLTRVLEGDIAEDSGYF
jgi:hypothetical protein